MFKHDNHHLLKNASSSFPNFFQLIIFFTLFVVCNFSFSVSTINSWIHIVLFFVVISYQLQFPFVLPFLSHSVIFAFITYYDYFKHYFPSKCTSSLMSVAAVVFANYWQFLFSVDCIYCENTVSATSFVREKWGNIEILFRYNIFVFSIYSLGDYFFHFYCSVCC